MGERGQITIERSIRERLGIRPKDVAVQRIEDGRLVVEFIRPHEPHMRSLAGVLGPAPTGTPAPDRPSTAEASTTDTVVGHAIAEEWRAYLSAEIPTLDRPRQRRSRP